MNHWKIDIIDNETFSADYRKLSDDSKEFVKDSIIELPTYKILSDYEYTIYCPSIPVGIVLLRFPNNCEVIVQARNGTLFYLRVYENIDEVV